MKDNKSYKLKPVKAEKFDAAMGKSSAASSTETQAGAEASQNSADSSAAASSQEEESRTSTPIPQLNKKEYTWSGNASQQASKHFDVVLAVDVHYTQVPPPPSFRTIPIPLPHPFVGIIFDPMDYLPGDISIPSAVQGALGMFMSNPPQSLPLGSSVYVHGRHKATTTTSVMGLGIPSPPKKIMKSPIKSPLVHITGSIPVYKIALGEMEAPHDGEVYVGSETVIVQGSEMSGDKPQQVLTCWGMGLGHQYFPPAWAALYNHISTLYRQFNTGNPVLIGGPFVPHKYSLSDILMRAATVLLMKGISKGLGAGLTKLNHFLASKFGKDNPISKALCKLGLEPVNFVTGAMSFEWEDFEILGSHTLQWKNVWESDNPYLGMLGRGVSNSYDLFLVPQEADGVVAFKHPLENQVVPLPCPALEGEFEYDRTWKIWQKRPDVNTWVIKIGEDVYTYQAFPHKEFGKIFRVKTLESAQGGVLNFHYNSRGEILTYIRDQAYRTLKFSATPDGTKIAFVHMVYQNQEDLLVSYQYDERGNLTRVFDAQGKSIDFYYDNDDRVVRRVNRNGMEYLWRYDSQGRVIYTTGKNQFQEGKIFYFPEEGFNEVRYTQKEGKIERYYYDEDFLVYKQVDAEGGETWYDYTPHHELTMVASPEGKITGYQYDERGNRKAVQAPDGEEIQYMYDEFNRLVYRKEPTGKSESWQYDTLGRLTNWQRLDESTVEYLYHEQEKQPYASKDSQGLETYWEYNAFGQMVKATNNRGAVQEFQYDKYGRLISQNRENEAPTYWRRDHLGRVSEFQTPGQKKLRIKYDAYDLPVHVSNGSEEWFMEYTPMGSLKKQSRRSAKTMEALSTLVYDYNAYEQLFRITNEKNEFYTFTRNRNDQIIKERDFDGQTQEYIRNLDGEIVKTLAPGGKEIYHQYDGAGRLTYNRYNTGYWESFEYDPLGRLVKAQNLMSEVEFIRNPFGQVTQERQGEHWLDYLYDERGQLQKLKSSLGAEIEYRYTAEGRLEELKAQTPITVQNPRNPYWHLSLQVDPDRRRVQRSMSGGVNQQMQYDDLGRPLAQTVTSDAGKTLDTAYRWKENFKLVETLNRLTGANIRYDYDAFGSLAQAHHSDGTTEYKNPDEVGNLYNSTHRKDRVYDAGGKLRKDTEWWYHYDEYGNLRFKTRTPRGSEVEASSGSDFSTSFLLPDGEVYDNIFDQKAEIRKYSRRELREYDKIRNRRQQAWEEKKEQKLKWESGDWEYLWYSNGMLQKVIKPDGSTLSFEYDALGRRTAKIVGNKIYRYLWDGNVLLHEWDYPLEDRPRLITDAEGEVKYNREEPVTEVTTWVYERGSFTPCAKIVGEEKYSLVSDYLGRPVQAYDRFGKLVWEAEYNLYGGFKELKGSPTLIPFRQAGQYEDVETGLYYNRFRYYSPETGQYISKDPIGLAGNNPNMYAYVYDSNTMVDLFGLDLITVYRFDTRSPSEIKAGGGFVAYKPDANVDLLTYAKKNPQSQYISTSYSLQSAKDFSKYHSGEGYIYKIEIDDSKGVNVNEVLGAKSPYPKENEFAVFKEIPNENIKGHTHAKDITDINDIKWLCPY
ncbi:type IV secretion protein Rhs [Apibacter muscae]|uniref:Type IV secretion protein Rhs n=1 Tax=Apibacter muscae TaxID=2509004 RepID=A0A563DLX4_9FLAO|nr:RHS repeat-associated core domain-containing protein [Apibacter muscae]TWP30814.1 type IV secretion protein Rhs [Apibacter muscae]